MHASGLTDMFPPTGLTGEACIFYAARASSSTSSHCPGGDLLWEEVSHPIPYSSAPGFLDPCSLVSLALAAVLSSALGTLGFPLTTCRALSLKKPAPGSLSILAE